jgi:hypothetical protein
MISDIVLFNKAGVGMRKQFGDFNTIKNKKADTGGIIYETFESSSSPLLNTPSHFVSEVRGQVPIWHLVRPRALKFADPLTPTDNLASNGPFDVRFADLPRDVELETLLQSDDRENISVGSMAKNRVCADIS